MTYFYKKQVALSYKEAIETVKKALAAQGFGVLTEIDVQAALKAKLQADHGPYTIIGACSPPLAYKALLTEREVGLLLPCNLIVYEEGDTVFVATIVPTVAMEKTGNQLLLPIAQEAESKLKQVIDSVSTVIS